MILALTTSNKDKADIALEDADNLEFQKKVHYSEFNFIFSADIFENLRNGYLDKCMTMAVIYITYFSIVWMRRILHAKQLNFATNRNHKN